jgi:N utilization substance protein B
MQNPQRSLSEDCKLFIKIFEDESIFVENQALDRILEDISILWIDDLAYALTWCCNTLEDLAKGRPWRLPDLYQSDMVLRRRPEAKVDSDKDFVTKLVRCALAGYETYFNKVVEMVPDWDKDRLFSSDMAIIACAMAEIENFKDIPAKVSLNEYVEISKFYCSPKSRSFVNGVLDRLIKENNLI